ncbi:5523_t:CDS:2, partial [Gigaspora rosea]
NSVEVVPVCYDPGILEVSNQAPGVVGKGVVVEPFWCSSSGYLLDCVVHLLPGEEGCMGVV